MKSSQQVLIVSMHNKNEFTRQHVEQILLHLQERSKPRWGEMTPQHIAEHLTISVKASIGKTKPVIVSNPEQIKQLKKQLLDGDGLWPQNLKNPLLPKGKLPDLKYSSLREAKEKLVSAVGEFEQYFMDHPEAMHPNPFLGYLPHEEWRQFHFKHFRHHFIQYGLLENRYGYPH